MYKIIHNKYVYEQSKYRYKDVRYTITNTDTAIKISLDYKTYQKETEYHIDYDIKKNDYRDTICTVFLGMKTNSTGKIFIKKSFSKVIFSDVIHSLDNDFIDLIRFYIKDDDIYMYIYYATATFEGFDNAEIVNDYIFDPRIFYEECVEAKTLLEKWQQKQNVVGNPIDMASSITYLESQVDVLYKLVALLLEKSDVDASEYENILTAVDDNSVLTIKSIDKITNELLTDKRRIRQIQEEYYKTKDDVS